MLTGSPFTVHPPRTVILTGREIMNVIPGIPLVDTGCKPGMHVELFNNAGSLAWRKHSSATKMLPCTILLEPLDNKGIEDIIPSGSEALVGCLFPGQFYYPLVASGETVTLADSYLRSNGAGLLAVAADADAADNVAKAQAFETLGALATDTRCRVLWNG